MSETKISNEPPSSDLDTTNAIQIPNVTSVNSTTSASMITHTSLTKTAEDEGSSKLPSNSQSEGGKVSIVEQTSDAFGLYKNEHDDVSDDRKSVQSEESEAKTWLETRSGSFPLSRPASILGEPLSGIYETRSRSTLSSSRRVSISRTFDRAQSLKNRLDHMTNTELVNAVQELQKNTRHYELENVVFQHFLEKYDRSLLEDMENLIKSAHIMQDRASISSRRLTLTRHSRRESLFMATSTSSLAGTGAAGFEKEGPKINITQKTDLILREMDDIQATQQKLDKKCHKIKHKLNADLEEMYIRESEIGATMDIFEQVFINGTLEKYTQKNPADRFDRFMEECFKQSRTVIDKLRLRTSSLKVQYQKIFNQLTQKKQLGENLQEVDFDQLQIENKHLVEKIEKRNLLLLELKKMNGQANLSLSHIKKKLFKKMDDLNEIQETIKFREDLIVKLDAECDKVASELEDTKAEYDKIKTKSENFRVPPVIDYVKKKAELNNLKKNLKIWVRRKQIKDMALNAAIREMKHITGLSSPQASWFEIQDYSRSRTSLEKEESILDKLSFDFAFKHRERKENLERKQKTEQRRKSGKYL